MVSETAFVLFWVLIGFAIIQFPLLWAFARSLRHPSSEPWPDDKPLPKTAVIMCLRGGDPFLADSLRAVFNQDYPSYSLYIIIDNPNDPSWSTVEEVIRQTGAEHVHVKTLKDPRPTCSLKCSSLVQVVSGLDESYEIVALVDADALPHRTWLRELIAPFAREDVGAVTGNRWYMPEQFSWGTVIRYLWNAAATVQMYCFHIPWGGTLAIRREVFRETDLLEKWGNAYCEDTMVYRVLRKQGLRVSFVPSLVMVNREDCSLSGCVEWVRRQLLAARLYHSWWPFTVTHALGNAAIWIAAIVVAVWGAATQNYVALGWGLGAASIYIAIVLAYLPILESAVRTPLRRRGEPTRWMTPAIVFAIPLSILLLQVLYPLVLVSTMCLRRVRWRGIDYHLQGSWRVRLVEYVPYEANPEEQRKLSL